MPLSIKGRIILEILEAMVYLAERHVIHKDIKPENILVDKDFHIKVYYTLWSMTHLLFCQHACAIMLIKVFLLPFPRLQTLVWPHAKRGANSQRRSHVGRVIRGDQLG